MLEIKKLGPIKLGPIARHKGVKGGRQRGETRGEREKKREEECRVLKTAQKFVGGAAGRPQNTCAIPRIREPVNAAPVAPRVACCVKKNCVFRGVTIKTVAYKTSARFTRSTYEVSACANPQKNPFKALRVRYHGFGSLSIRRLRFTQMREMCRTP